jgi:VWFA-related protein
MTRGFLTVFILIGIACANVGQGLTPQGTIRTDVDLVVIPASVKDGNGRFIYDLQQQDFRIFEDGRPQEIQRFSIDPVPLSAVVLVDTAIGGSALRRFSDAVVTLSSAFTPMDEAEIYRFDKFVTKLSDFTNSDEAMEKSLVMIKEMSKNMREEWSPLAVFPGRGPRWLRKILDRGVDTRLLNDAVLAAESDLEKRPAEKRKVIIAISDGQTAQTEIKFEDIRDRLVQHQIQFYAVTVALPLLDRTTSVLRAYADASGGDVYSGRTRDAMQNAFSQITEQARHQYVLSYISNNEAPGPLPVSRKVQVQTTRSDLKVHHRTQYLQYPSRR